MKKRSVLLLLVLILLLTACTPAVREQSTTTPTTQTTTETAVPPTETTLPAILKNTDRYPLEGTHKLRIVSSEDVEGKLFWTEYAEAAGIEAIWQTQDDQAMLATFDDPENMPDIYWQANGLMETWRFGKINTELLVDFMEHLDQMPNLKALYEEDPMIFSQVADDEGRVFSLPVVSDMPTMRGNLFYIRTDMTKEAGWETLPETAEDFLVMCEDLKRTYADVEDYYPMVCSRLNDFAYDGYYTAFFFPAFGELMQAGITMDSEQKTIVAGFTTDQYRRYLGFVKQLIAEGYVDPESYLASNYASSTQNLHAKQKMIDKTTTMNPFATYLVPDNFESGEMDFQVMPPLSSQYQQEARWARFRGYGNGYCMVSANCADLDAALAFLDACYAPWEDPIREEGNLCGVSLWLGERDKYMSLDEETGTYRMIPDEDYALSCGYHVFQTHCSGKELYRIFPYYEHTGTGLDVKAAGVREYLYPAAQEIISTEYLLQNKGSIYEAGWRELDECIVKWSWRFVDGQANLDLDWEAYLEELNALGLQQVIDIYQVALDRYWE